MNMLRRTPSQEIRARASRSAFRVQCMDDRSGAQSRELYAEISLRLR